jgi:hypothetical protein
MKAKHRHELKTNELAEWIANFPQWAKENVKTIIYVSVVIVLVGGSYLYHKYQKNVVRVRKQFELTGLVTQLSRGKMEILNAQASGMDTSPILIQMADNLLTVAQNTKNDRMAAFALIKRAEALRTELHYRFGTPARQHVTTQINRAKASYTQALEKSSGNPSLIATAKFGLGLCEEELGNFDKARQIYTDITTDASLDGTIAVATAKHRLKTMADYQHKVVFRPAPRPIPPDLLKPEIELKPVDVNQVPPAPNVVPFVPDINLRLETPNTIPVVLDINLESQTPNNVPEIPDINLSSK